jgi:hypothetical protein
MDSRSTLQIPSGFASSDEDIGYVVGLRGFIYCLNLASGDVLAQTDFSATPLTLYRDMLIGWALEAHGSQMIAIFALVRSENVLWVRWQQPLQLPDWVEVDSIEADAFSIFAEVQDQLLAVTWEARSLYAGGAYPPASVESAAANHERRTIIMEPESGEKTAPPPIPMSPTIEDRALELEPTKRVVPYRSGAGWETRSWRTGSADLLLVREVDAPGILLHRLEQDTDASEDIRLSSDPGAIAAVTPDGEHIFIHEPVKAELPWKLFSATGERLARLPLEPGAESVAVVNERVLYVVSEESEGLQRKTMRCRELPTGKTLWSFRLSEEALTAPPPLRPQM